MNSITNRLLKDRVAAGRLLSRKLSEFKETDAVVIGIPNGGVCVAYAISEALSLPMEVMSCRKIENPGNWRKNIGSISMNDVFIHDCMDDLPQDYIYHQILFLRKAMENEQNFFYRDIVPVSVLNRTVILVDEVMLSSDVMMTCLRSIKMEKPSKIIVSVPLVSEEAAKAIRNEIDDLQFIRMSSTTSKAYFDLFPQIDHILVRDLLCKSKHEG